MINVILVKCFDFC